jgi:hypothetical protein
MGVLGIRYGNEKRHFSLMIWLTQSGAAHSLPKSKAYTIYFNCSSYFFFFFFKYGVMIFFLRVLLTSAHRAMFKEAFNTSTLWEVVKI